MVSCAIYGQIEDYEVINFSVENGLPSNECHDMVQDSLGYIWIATDRGLSRFDGYGFKNYGKKEGLGDLSCLQLFLDRHNNIWISTLGKKIYKYISSSDTIIPYKYNYLLEPYYVQSPFNFMLYLDKKDNAYFGIYKKGIIQISAKGDLILPDTIKIQLNQIYSYEVENKFMAGIISVNNLGNNLKINVGYIFYKTYINHKGINFVQTYDVNQQIFGNARAFKYSDSAYVYSVHGHHYFFNNRTLAKVKTGNEINDILVLENGGILTAQIFRQGVKLFKNNNDFMNDKGQPFIDNI